MDSTPTRTTIGVFDSGVGGLSILAELLRVLPQCNWVYIADSGYAPYGERTEAFVLDRSLHLAGTLIEKRHCQSVVIACNTATAIAAQAIRANWPDIPVVGVEPGIKPASQRTRNRKIGVLATAATLGSLRYRALVSAHASEVELIEQACSGLALAIENGDLENAEISRLLDAYCFPLAAAGVDTVVLGCTHYSFVKEQIRLRFPPGTEVIDTAQAVAQQARRLNSPVSASNQPFDLESAVGVDPAIASANPADAQQPPGIRLLSSDDPARLVHFMQSWVRAHSRLIAAEALG
jgi:glutamate racemase